MPSSTAPRLVRPLLAFAVAVFAGGVVVAVAQPGNVGDEDDGTEASATTTSAPGGGPEPEPGPEPDGTTTSSTVEVTVSSAPTATTAGAGPATTATTGTTAPGSGLGTGGNSRADDATAETGMESLLGPGLALGGIAVVLRRAGRRRH